MNNPDLCLCYREGAQILPHRDERRWYAFVLLIQAHETCFTHPGRSWAQQLYAGRLNSGRWCLSPSGSALWPPLPPGWRPGPWSCPPCDQSAVWTEHRSGFSKHRWGWSVRTQLLKNTEQKKKGRFFKWWHTQNTQDEHKCQGWVSQQQLESGLILQETAQVLTALFLPSYPFFPSLSHLSFAMQLLALSVTAGQIQTHNITEAWLYLKPAGFLSTFLQTDSAAGHETYKCSSVMFCNH